MAGKIILFGGVAGVQLQNSCTCFLVPLAVVTLSMWMLMVQLRSHTHHHDSVAAWASLCGHWPLKQGDRCAHVGTLNS